jgi:glucuronate isomerase
MPTLHPDRFFSSDPAVRAAARAIYDDTRALPIVSPHGHVDAALLADDAPFPEPTALLITPDHYVFRMLYSQGVPLEALGIPQAGPDGDPDAHASADPRRVWQVFASHYHLFGGTPTRAWFDYELAHVFGVADVLGADTADRVYDQIAERLAGDDFRPRALFERFGIEVLTTTDAATDPLDAHRRLADDPTFAGHVRPCFRPDAVMRIAAPGWTDAIERLEQIEGNLPTYADFLDALARRRAFFKQAGAFATDHAVVQPVTGRAGDAEVERIYQRALSGEATQADQRTFEAHFLMDQAEQATRDGLVMQLHAGALRDHNEPLAAVYGPDKGADIPVRTEYTQNLRPLLSAYGSNPDLGLILFTLDESTYARELAPLAGHYPAVTLGPAWWFHDSVEGMTRFRERTTETAGIYNTAGFNDDTRAFCSIPARHDLARRVDANYLGGLVARHQIGLAEARRMGRALAYDLPRRAYRLDAAGVPRTSDDT